MMIRWQALSRFGRRVLWSFNIILFLELAAAALCCMLWPDLNTQLTRRHLELRQKMAMMKLMEVSWRSQSESLEAMRL